MKKKIVIAVITILVILMGVYIGINYKKPLSGRAVTLTGKFVLPEQTKGCVAFLYTDDYNLGTVDIYSNFPEGTREQFKEQEGCALQEYFNGKNVKIKGKLEYVVCGPPPAQCIGEFWAMKSVDSIEIIE